MIKITVDNKLTITDLPGDVADLLEDRLTLKNPEWRKAKAKTYLRTI